MKILLLRLCSVTSVCVCVSLMWTVTACTSTGPTVAANRTVTSGDVPMNGDDRTAAGNPRVFGNEPLGTGAPNSAIGRAGRESPAAVLRT